MSIITFQGGDAVTMTSQEIAGLTEKLHKNVIRDIREMLEALEKDGSDLSHVREDLDARGYTENFHLNRELTETLITGYSIPLRHKVIRRLHELEQQVVQRNAFEVPRTRADALRLAADLEEQNGVLLLENKQQARKIESLEHFFMPGETPAQFAKRLNGVNSLLITGHLLDLGWIWNSERRAKKKPKYRTTYLAREKDLLTERPRKIDGEDLESPIIRYELQLLEEGSKVLHDLYMAEKLPMKKTWDGRFFYDKFTPENPL
ncbi:Rha family transcriptional regulator [Pseudomonas putida]|uniref:Phage regulatory protein Rha n=1 Tax=Pseudomonas putida TaxID=303 RepID=A0A1B2F143_PSEPU|nr:Rha family transcriptional regulator [Pseudomonas putida]ANY85961.1 Phage regulatory protein Rha [Pseudomonas putida]